MALNKEIPSACAEHAIVPCSLSRSVPFVEKYHRHNSGLRRGLLYSVGLLCSGKVVGVAVVGVPSHYTLMDGLTAEVKRVCVLEGHPNGNSMLYAAAWAAGKGMGFRRMLTYTLDTESQSTMKAVGWKLEGQSQSDPKGWAARPNREMTRAPAADTVKNRWAIQDAIYPSLKARSKNYTWPMYDEVEPPAGPSLEDQW